MVGGNSAYSDWTSFTQPQEGIQVIHVAETANNTISFEENFEKFKKGILDPNVHFGFYQNTPLTDFIQNGINTASIKVIGRN